MPDQRADTIKRCLQIIKQLRRNYRQQLRVFDARFHAVRQLAQRHRACHARAAFQGVQQTLQRLRHQLVIRTRTPVAQILPDLRHQFCGFFEEYLQQLRINIVFETIFTPPNATALGRRGH